MSRMLCIALLLLAGCAGGPSTPDWQVYTHGALAAHTRAWLAGDTRVAARELAIARREAGRTGSAEPLARVELTACAALIASLDAADCPAAQPLLQDAGAEVHAYAAYLAGQWDGLDREKLPPAQRGVPAATDVAAQLQSIDDPLSRLVAAALLLRAGRLAPEGIDLAIDTASKQGWRRPLLAWLGFDRDRRLAAGDRAGAAERQRRIGYALSPSRNAR
ncbi:MAG: hypothetical protein AB1443_09070 [Pseudomonadota bacterium]